MTADERLAVLREVVGDERLATLMTALDERLAGLPAPLDSGSAEAVLHSLRGAASMLAQDRLADILKALETVVTSGDGRKDDIAVLLAEVARERRVLAALISQLGISHLGRTGDSLLP